MLLLTLVCTLCAASDSMAGRPAGVILLLECLGLSRLACGMCTWASRTAHVLADSNVLWTLPLGSPSRLLMLQLLDLFLCDHHDRMLAVPDASNAPVRLLGIAQACRKMCIDHTSIWPCSTQH